ncbi:glycoside hydrolase family protein [Mycolicibacterium aubagnense]|uniref:Tetratricopeptide repeat protein n=2 Tax=Mycolicibacterium aubagnense TaxID=319707 RepID=A0ABN5YPI6_9MYCO|nr:tetratricopeptide repeat protein [Mycolicibacterium aubagnense]BBX83712.1 hypothetical protein MAUB_15850 [Mycolicibacterium aubagnense]
MQSRDAALAAVLHRLDRVAPEGPGVLLKPEALTEAESLAAVIDPRNDSLAARALATFHWFRYLALPEGADQDDFEAAVVYFAPLLEIDPYAGPELIRRRVLQDIDTKVGGVDPGYLTSEAVELFTTYEQTGKLSLLTYAVELFRAAVSATPADHADNPGRQNNLGIALRTLSERTENGEQAPLLAEAMQAGRNAVAGAPPGHRDHAMHMNNLGTALQVLAGRTGDLETLRKAVAIGREAVGATPADDGNRAANLSNFGNGLRELFEHTGDTAYLSEAIEAGHEAVDLTPPGHRDRPIYLNNLGIALRLMYERSRETKFLNDAVRVGREAVAGTPEDDSRLATYLNSLEGSLAAAYEHTRQIAYLEEAIEVIQRALAVTAADDPSVPTYLNNLAIATVRRGERLKDTSALADAIRASRDAVDLTPVGHPDRAGYLNGLGASLLTLHRQSGETAALNEARQCFTEAAEITSAPARARIAAYQTLASLDGQAGIAPADALAAVEAAVALLPQVVSRTLARADREHSLGQLMSLPALAASVAVAAGRLERAVELLELTRGILVADTLDARSNDLARLRQRNPKIADQFERLRRRIGALENPATAPPDTKERGTALAQARRDAHAAFDQLIEQIRTVDGFAGFFRPPNFERIAAQAQGGPIIFTYTSPVRSDALIVTSDPVGAVRHVPLPGLTDSEARSQANLLLAAQQATADPAIDINVRSGGQRVILDVLSWTWNTITEPILAALGHLSTPAEGEPWPRVWWCPVGTHAYLPLHAAGHHNRIEVSDSQSTVLDRVVSSYIMTVRGLGDARNLTVGESGKTLIVAVPDAPGNAG